jgi:hypothetical protein
MEADQLQDWILAGNSAAMDWYALMHDQPLPSQSLLERTLGADLGAVSPTIGLSARGGISGTQILIVAAVIFGAFYLLRKT